jgi:hypothetical protein
MDAALASKKSAKRSRKTLASKKKTAPSSAPKTPAPPVPEFVTAAEGGLSPVPQALSAAATVDVPAYDVAGGSSASALKRPADLPALAPQPKRGRGVSTAGNLLPSSSSRGTIYRPEWELTAEDSAFDDHSSAMQFLFHALLPKDYAVMDAASDEEVMGSAARNLCRVSFGLDFAALF